MPQLDLTFFSVGALQTCIAFFVLLYLADVIATPLIAEAIKTRTKLLNINESLMKTDETLEEVATFTIADLDEVLATYDNDVKNLKI